ncbi:STAS/SEC14 domain-containing protein [Oceaniserpentilla sp. 4NH20-0058]|uniref:STAS/SEC14 domain-containing protein n=1 Tax=Oceaniserpentilla sp. 4NH20-0058 TaxID=3127660 RepID=UPI003109F5E9
MTLQKHGLTIGMERVGEAVFLSLKVQGKLTHDDYQTINPMLDSVLAQLNEPKVKVFIDASELQGWELRAAWDDLKLGLKHGNEFTHIAIYGNKKWLELAAKLGAWFTKGEIKYFEDHDESLLWLSSH